MELSFEAMQEMMKPQPNIPMIFSGNSLQDVVNQMVKGVKVKVDQLKEEGLCYKEGGWQVIPPSAQGDHVYQLLVMLMEDKSHMLNSMMKDVTAMSKEAIGQLKQSECTHPNGYEADGDGIPRCRDCGAGI